MKLGSQVEVLFRDDSVQNYGLVMFATGRRPGTKDLGLEESGYRILANTGEHSGQEVARLRSESVELPKSAPSRRAAS